MQDTLSSTLDESNDLCPSALGTKEHWDTVYARELSNFEEIGDEGEVWFGTETVEKMVEWSLQYVPPASKPSILEIGSGNGAFLFALCGADYEPTTLVGIDYSPDAVRLARAVVARHKRDDVMFSECDFLKDDPPKSPCMDESRSTEVWDVLVDKGTYDAIALGEVDENGISPAARYPRRVERLLKPGGLFFITSCNFTEDELRETFANAETNMIYHSRVQHATFSYGGRHGSMYSSVAFRKKDLRDADCIINPAKFDPQN